MIKGEGAYSSVYKIKRNSDQEYIIYNIIQSICFEKS